MSTIYYERERYYIFKNAITDKRCYNCALRKKCEKENPALFEPIGTCGKWINEVNGQMIFKI